MLTLNTRDDLCLAFVNTRYWRGSATPTEELKALPDLVNWLVRSVAMGTETAHAIETSCDTLGERAPALFDEAIAMRETVCRIFSALAEGEPVGSDDLKGFAAALATAPPRDRLACKGDTCGWIIEAPLPSMPELLAPVLWSTGDLMVNAPHRRIRRCANEKCLWLFIDESKSGTRRWCQMSACGNRAKARRHYAKVKNL